jgi:protein-tyrosine phosphatase
MTKFRLSRAATSLVLAASLTGTVTNAHAAEPVVAEATVERAADGSAIVQWHTTQTNAPIDVSLVLPRQAPQLVSDNDRDGQHRLTPEQARQRPLVMLAPHSGPGFVTAERVVPLEGGRNFRDLGGYRTADGRRVKWGQVYRSGTMAGLTDADYEQLSALGIDVICDFRSKEERELEPTDFARIGADIAYLTRDYISDTSVLRTMFGEGRATPESVRAAMTTVYGELPYEHADSYRTMFGQLAEGKLPLAFNCSAGKDRTGVAAALLLTLLGVPRETVLADYALSEKVVNYERAYARPRPSAAADKPDPYAFIAELPAEVRAPLLRSDPAYLDHALAEIARREGSVEGYFANVLELSPTDIEAIRARLLE